MTFNRLVLTALFSCSLVAAAQTAAPVPAAYQSLYSELQGDLTTFSQAIATSWNGTPFPTLYASQALTTNSDLGSSLLSATHFTYTVVPELQELKALGVTAVCVHINFPILYGPYYTNQQDYQGYVSFYQQVAQQIHAMGMKMIVETTVATAEAGTSGANYTSFYAGLTWNEYMAGRAQTAVNVAELIRPDFMSVITEPDSESQNSSQPSAGTPSGSLQELQTILAALKAANVTNVPVGAGAGTWIKSFSTYIQNVISTPISYVDLHMYSMSNAFPENALAAAKLAHAAGLPITMSETWCNKVSASQLTSAQGTLNDTDVDALGTYSFWEPLDEQYLQDLVNMAQAGQFTFISPFWSSFYYGYLDYGTYGTQSSSAVITAEQAAATNARQVGAFTPVGLKWETLILPSPDTTVPQVPAPPVIGQFSQNAVQVGWNPTTDNVGVAGYNLFRNGTLIYTSSQVNYTDTSVAASTAYSYQVQAFDAAGNLSAQSAPAKVTTLTPPDNTAPSAPKNVTGKAVGDQQIQLTWSPSTDNVSVAGYRVYRGASPSSLALYGSVTTTQFADTSIAPKTTYYYAVMAFDPSYNYSAQSATASVTSSADTTAPTVPTNVVATGTGLQQVNLSWKPSTDDVYLAGYSIYRGKTSSSMIQIGNSTTTSFVDTTGLAPGTGYYYSVAAYDEALNYSAQSALTTANTLADMQPPTVPQNLIATAKSGTQINLTWSASADNVVVASYQIYRGTSSKALSLIGSSPTPSYMDSASLKANQIYYYAVTASDISGNASAQSSVSSVTHP